MQVTVQKLVHGGQGIADLTDGRKVFVWNALPGEVVDIEIVKSKRSYAEAIASNVLVANPARIEPAEPELFLATSPWQIMSADYEDEQKVSIIKEVYDREKVHLPHFRMISGDTRQNYRNKMEFSFYGDDEGVHLAFFNRGTHRKQIVTGSKLARPEINNAANEIVNEINKKQIRAGDLKSVILRCQQNGEVVASLFTKRTDFPQLSQLKSLKGLRIYFSNPRSPASVPTQLLKVYGEDTLVDEINSTVLHYDVNGFFQINLPVFHSALAEIQQCLKAYSSMPVIDMYSGVGSIGLCLEGTEALIELDWQNVIMAQKNAINKKIKVVQASTESSLDYVRKDSVLVVDPPRAGLHQQLMKKILEVQPKVVSYLSCNPATQARDARLMIDGGYKIEYFSAFNFFPMTPHIESLFIARC